MSDRKLSIHRVIVNVQTNEKGEWGLVVFNKDAFVLGMAMPSEARAKECMDDLAAAIERCAVVSAEVIGIFPRGLDA